MDGVEEGGIWMVVLKRYDGGVGMVANDLVELWEEPLIFLEKDRGRCMEVVPTFLDCQLLVVHPRPCIYKCSLAWMGSIIPCS